MCTCAHAIKTRTGVSTERLVGLSGLAVGHVNLAVASAAADEQTAPVGRVFDETNVPDRAVVHGQLDLLSFQVGRFRVELHQLHRLVVASSRYQRTVRRPRHAIYRTLVVSGPFEQHRRLLSHMILPVEKREKKIITDERAVGASQVT